MTVLDRLLEIGITCPCGMADISPEVVDTDDRGADLWEVGCICCGRTNLRFSSLDAVTAWIILTGGPVPGEIPPPNTWNRWMQIVDTWVFASQQRLIVQPKEWMFSPSERTPEIITPWLGMEVKP